MCRNATVRGLGAAIILLHASSIGTIRAQTVEPTLEWRRIGSTSIDMALPAPATGPVARVWYNADGSALFAQTRNGRIWTSTDFETWKPSAGQIVPTKIRIAAARLPGPPTPAHRLDVRFGREQEQTSEWRSHGLRDLRRRPPASGR